MARIFGTNAQVAPLKQTALQPTGIPGSTFVRPQERQVGGNLNALASALGNLNSSLQGFANVKAQLEDDPQSRDNKEWIARRQQMSLEQLQEEAKNGTPDGIRIREDALNAQLAERANDDFRKDWLNFYNTEFDRTSGSAAEEYEKRRQEFAAGLPSEIARGNFYRLTGDHFSSWMQKDTEDKVTLAKQELNTTIVDGFRNSIDDSINVYKLSAQDAARIVFQKSAGNRDFLGLSGQEQNETIFRIAEEYALRGDEGVARALLEGSRKGADGRPMPPLVKIAGYTDKAIQLMDRAGDMRRKEVRKNGLAALVVDDALVAQGAFTPAEAEKRRNSGLYTDAELAGMVDQSNRARLAAETKWAAAQQKRALRALSEQQQDKVYSQAFGAMSRFGGINDLKDIEIASPTGEGTKTVTRQEQIDAVIQMKEDGFKRQQEDLIAKDTDPEAARAQVNRLRVDWYAGNKIVNEQWQNTLNGIAGRASMDTLLQKGEVTAYLKDSAKLYRDLKATNPSYLSTVLQDAKSKDFLDAYDNAVSTRRMPEDEALLYAAHITSQPENIKAKNMISRDDADKLAVSTLRDLGVDERSSNYQFVIDRISSMSANGATDKEIKKSLEDEISSTAVPINGMLVFDHRDLPDDFPELMQDEIKNRFTLQGARYGITDPSDLYIIPDGNEAKWYVMSKSLRMPIGTAPITPQSLEAGRNVRRASQELQIRNLAKAKDADRAKLKAEYDASIAEDQARIDFWSNAATKRQKLSKTLAQSIATKLQQNLDARKARDADLIATTPAQRAERRNKRLQEQGRANAKNLGFKVD